MPRYDPDDPLIIDADPEDVLKRILSGEGSDGAVEDVDQVPEDEEEPET